MIILDTNVVSALVREPMPPQVAEWFDLQSRALTCTTAITVFELRYGVEMMPKGERRDRLAAVLAQILAETLGGRIIPLDARSADAAGRLMARRRAAGRTVEATDTLIAGIALAHRATVATRNLRHFADLEVQVINPWAA
jgi:predicted nucleic acid-binding protein